MKLLFLLLSCLYLFPLQAQVTTFQHPWQNARVAYFGDSVTDPNVSTGPNNNHYWSYLQSWLGITPLVYAVNGRQWDDIPRQTDQLFKDHHLNVDAILIFIGTNDFNSGLPIGEFYHEMTEKVWASTGEPKAYVARKRRVPVMTNDTYCGRINIALHKIKSLYPEKQVVLLTPIHRGYASFGERNIQPDESYQTRAVITLTNTLRPRVGPVKCGAYRSLTSPIFVGWCRKMLICRNISRTKILTNSIPTKPVMNAWPAR